MRARLSLAAVLVGLGVQPDEAPAAYDLSEQWRWREYSTRDGLPSDRIKRICETPGGTLWVITEAGLAWYDGFRWQPVDPARGLPRGRVRWVSTLPEDRLVVTLDQRLYVGGPNGFQSVPLVFEGTSLLAGRHATTADGRILLIARANPDAKPAFFELRDEHLARMDEPAAANEDGVNAVWCEPPGTPWVHTAEGLYRRGPEGWELRLATKAWHTAVDLHFTAEGEQVLWHSHVEPGRGLWHGTAKTDLNLVLPVGIAHLRGLACDAAGFLVAVFDSGTVWTRRNGVWQALERPPAQLRGVESLHWQSNGDLWVATGHGLTVFKAGLRVWTHLVNPSAGALNRVHDFVLAPDGTLWMGGSDGVSRYDAAGEFEHFDRIDGQPIPGVTGIARDGRGQIWITSGARWRGAYRFDGAEWAYFGPAQGVPGYCHKARTDRQGRVWLLGLGEVTVPDAPPLGTGAIVVDGDRCERWTTEDGLPHNRVYDLVEDPDGALWFATLEGLSRWHAGLWTHWTEREGLRFPKVWSLTVDTDGTLWFADQHNGLGSIRDGEPGYLTTEDGLPSNEIQNVRADPLGGIWVTYPGGVARLRGDRRYELPASGGIGHWNLWPVLPTPERVYVGTLGGGTAVLDRTLLEEVQLKLQVDGPLIRPGSATFHWHATAKQAAIPPVDIETRHRIDDGLWSPWSGERSAVAPILPGRHTLSVEARSRLAEAPAVLTVLAFRLPYPIHEQPLVLALLVGSVTVISALILAGIIRQRRYTQVLLESEQRFRTLADNAPIMIWMCDESGRCTYANRRMACFSGLEVEETVRFDWMPLVQPDDRDRVQEAQQVALRREGSFELEYRMMRHDGESRWIYGLGSPRSSADGRFLGLIGSCLDVTELKQAEAALQEAHDELESRVARRTAELAAANRSLQQEIAERSLVEDTLREREALLHSVVEGTDDAVFVKDLEGRYLLVNSADAQGFDRAVEDILGATDADLFAPEVAARAVATDRQTIQSGKGMMYEEVFRFPHVGKRTYLVSKYPRIDAAGEVVGVIGIARDITERRAAELELERYRAHLEELVEHRTQELEASRQRLRQAERLASVGTLAAGVAHEINNPVGGILLAAQNALQDEGSTDEAALMARALRKITENARRCGRIVRSLLQFARREKAEKWLVNLYGVIEHAVEATRDYASRQGAVIDIQVSPGLPDVLANPIELEQALVNVLTNAVEAGPGGVRVMLRASAEGDAVRIVVRDDGRGMAPDEQQRVFDPFYTTRRVEGGTGLGLSIVHGIIEDHGGRIALESAPGVGTTVVLELPRVRRGEE